MKVSAILSGHGFLHVSVLFFGKGTVSFEFLVQEISVYNLLSPEIYIDNFRSQGTIVTTLTIDLVFTGTGTRTGTWSQE
jgi:hypothetical protein